MNTIINTGTESSGGLFITTPTGLTFSTANNFSTAVSSTSSFTTPAGSSGSIVLKKTSSDESEAKGVSAKFIFKFVKSKLTELEKTKLEVRLKNLSSMLVYAKDVQQWAVYEDCAKKILELVREQEANLFGIKQVINKKDVEKFIPRAKGKIIKFKELSEFPRIIPTEVRKKLKKLQDKNIFDNYYILYTDQSTPEEEVKSNKVRVLEKDPILFGTFNNIQDKLYFIADWEDEYCSLSLNELVESLQELDKDYAVDEIEALTPDYIEELKQDLLSKQKRLSETRGSNFRELAKEEDREREKLRQATESSIIPEVEQSTQEQKSSMIEKFKKFFKI